MLAGLTVFNAVIGLRQEAKAEESVRRPRQMMKSIARVRRDGQAIEIDAEELVPGDVVLVEAGNRVPADGRVFLAATLEIEEAALTGESLPVAQGHEPIAGRGRRRSATGICMAYMNTSVTRGRGEMIVTATGMDTEIGHIADMLNKTETDKTPLQKQLDGLSKIIASHRRPSRWSWSCCSAWRSGESFDTLFITGVALAVAAIPTGLPAVVTALLSMGTREIARPHAIVKRLPVGRDARLDLGHLLGQDRHADPQQDDGPRDRHPRPEPLHGLRRGLRHRRARSATSAASAIDLDAVLCCRWCCAPMPCSTARSLIGDPTEGALIVLGAKGGLDIDETRGPVSPRRRGAVRLRLQVHGDLPRDDRGRRPSRSCAATSRARRTCSSRGPRPSGTPTARWCRSPTTTGTSRSRPTTRSPTPASGSWWSRSATSTRPSFDPDGDLIDQVQELTLLAMVGIVDPPRPEARAAIAECHERRDPGPHDHRRPRRRPRPRSPASWASRAGRSPAPSSPR